MVQSLGKQFLNKISLDTLFQLCEKMIEGDSLENIELGIEALGTIFYSIDEIHEKHFVNTVELFQKYFELQPGPGRSANQVARLKEGIVCSLGKMVYVAIILHRTAVS